MEPMEGILAETVAQFLEFAGRGVLVTGGATGIGAAVVEAFARQGARVSFLDIDAASGAALAARLSDEVAEPVSFLPVDLTDIPALQEAIASIVDMRGPIGVLVNNAARDDRHAFDSFTVEEWDANQAVNLRHVFFAAQAVAPSMRRLGGGAIVNLSSIAFLLNMAELPAYAAAKAGIIGLTKSMAGALGPDNIRVNAILPGMIVTERQRRLWLSEEGIAAGVERQCLKRVLDADAITGPCLFLASTLSAAMTAQTMIVDGGIL
jgi:NAD(P)-dependent dehydrogenase (short-subunit alcohol dehydrogenase family)